jgi:hypothetical protein
MPGAPCLRALTTTSVHEAEYCRRTNGHIGPCDNADEFRTAPAQCPAAVGTPETGGIRHCSLRNNHAGLHSSGVRCEHTGGNDDAEPHERCKEPAGHEREHSNSRDQRWFIKVACKGSPLPLEDRLEEIRCEFARGRGRSTEYLANQYNMDCVLEAIKIGIIEKPRLSPIELNVLLYPPEKEDS